MMDRRDFLGFSVSTVPLVGLVGPVWVRSLDQFAALPLPAPGPGLVEWLNEAGEGPRLGRYAPPLTQRALLEAVATCWLERPRTITLSLQGCTDFVTEMGGERRYVAPADMSGGYSLEADAISLMAPGHQLRIEVHTGLPDGFLTIG
jgi:hypothetical protein